MPSGKWTGQNGSQDRKVTVDQARQMLGEKSKNMKDSDIQSILDFLYLLSNEVIETFWQTSKGDNNAN